MIFCLIFICKAHKVGMGRIKIEISVNMLIAALVNHSGLWPMQTASIEKSQNAATGKQVNIELKNVQTPLAITMLTRIHVTNLNLSSTNSRRYCDKMESLIVVNPRL
jgi:hypothetical protein